MKIFRNALMVGAGTLLALSVSEAAEAGTFIKDIDFTDGASGNFSELFYELGNGLTLTVTAGFHSGGAGANAPLNIIGDADVARRGGGSPGIGVKNSGPDDSQLDASGRNDFLRFTFNKEVTLLSTIFEAASSLGSGTDEFDAGIDGVDLQIIDTFGTDNLVNFPGAGFSGSTDRLVDFSGGVDFAGDGTDDLLPATGLVFDFYTDDSGDDYRIREMKVSVDVPEPASVLGLVGFGSVAAGTMLKRKREQTA
jgi:hypothetical protein